MPEDRTIIDLIEVRPIVLVPVGSWEQHGPHLPFDTDTVIATELVRRASEALHDVPTLVTSSIGFSANIEASPAIWNGRIYVGSRSGFFYAVGDE